MSDAFVKAMGEDRPPWVFEEQAFTQPPPLNEATVAIVSTASLHHAEQDDFAPADTGYRILDNSKRDFQTGHWSPNYC